MAILPHDILFKGKHTIKKYGFHTGKIKCLIVASKLYYSKCYNVNIHYFNIRGHSKSTFVEEGRGGVIETRTKTNRGREGDPNMSARSLF